MYLSLSGCWVWTRSTAGKGYGQIWVNGRIEYVHRVSYEVFVGRIPHGLLVCHKCDNPPCANPDHLFVGTHKDNYRDSVNKNRHTPPKGEEHWCRRLSDDVVRTIRNSNDTCKKLARRFGVSERTVRGVINGETLKHVQ